MSLIKGMVMFIRPPIDEDFQENLIDDSQSYLSNMNYRCLRATTKLPGLNLDQQVGGPNLMKSSQLLLQLPSTLVML